MTRLIAGTAFLCAFVVVTNAAAQQPSHDEQSMALVKKLCGSCHPPENAVAGRRTIDQWDETISKMVAKGLKANESDLDALYDFLIRKYGRVNINWSMAGDMALVLSLTAGEARAIVAYREAHGEFADFDAVTKVPGVDLKKLETNREAISF